ncbi:MAG: hydrolase [Tuberibacillus sp.]
MKTVQRGMLMEKKRYYVKVGTGEILPEKTLSEWEFEIEATPEEAGQLEHLFSKTDHESFTNFFKAHVPLREFYEEENIPYDKKLQQVYQLLYDLGTEETKEHIRSMDILS